MLTITNAKENFSKVYGGIDYSSVCKFLHKVAEMIPDTVDVDTLVLAFKIAFQDSSIATDDSVGFIAIIPHYVREFSSPEFAHEFRRKYNREVLGLTQEELPDVDYGYKEVKTNVIDISNKDRNDVLAALYNASTPIGMGFMQYNPMPWTREIAAMYFEEYGKPNKEGNITFDYVLGRPLKCTFKGNLVYVLGYNNDNEWGLAQRAIATCPNIEPIQNRFGK